MYTVPPNELLDRRARRRGCAISFFLLLWLIMLPAYVAATCFSTLLHTATEGFKVEQKQWNVYIDSPMVYVDGLLCAALFLAVLVLSSWRPTRKTMRGLIVAVAAFSIYILAKIPNGGF